MGDRDENGELIDIDHVIVQIAKLRQIASGFFYDEQHTAVHLKCSKLDLLEDVLKDPGMAGQKPKVIVWAAHTAELRMIRQMAAGNSWKSVAFFGSDRKAKEQARKSFRDDPSVRLFVGQVDAGVGMNELIVADTAIYYSNSTKVVSRQQSERRNRRIGSEIHRSITYYDLLTEGTIDKHVLSCVKRHMSLATTILNELKQGRKIRNLLT